MDLTKGGNMTTCLIDADIIMYRFAWKHQKKTEWANGITSITTDEGRAINDADRFIGKIVRVTKCMNYRLCFTHKVNFRYSLMSDYKANRANKPPPELLPILRKHLWDNHPCIDQEWLEADDLMGIMGTRDPKEYILATSDKDFKTLPVLLYLWNDKKPKVKRVDMRTADYWFHFQWLTGDTTDNFKGVKGIGKVKAKEILNSVQHKNFTRIVIETYADKCYSWKELLTQARMARILRCSDWDDRRKEVILWNPSNY
jgi:DNA polymerase-1